MLVGDAAAFIDPFVGDGISIALRTGTLAATELQSVFEGKGTLSTAAQEYARKYARRFSASILTAARIRKLQFWPRPLQIAVFELLRTPGVLPYFIRRTRHAAGAD